MFFATVPLENVKVAVTVLPDLEQETDDTEVLAEHVIEEGNVISEGKVIVI